MAMKATIRLASKQDVPLITKLVHQFAEVSGNASTCTATDSNLLELLFSHPPFEGPTVFLLEASESQCAKKDAKKVMVASGDEETSVTKNSISTLESPPIQMVAEVKNIRPRPGGRGRVSNRGRDLSEDGEECSSPLADDVEIELFRSTSNVNYRGKFLKDFKVGTTSLEVVESSSDANMEEPVLEVFKSTTDVTLDDVVDVYASAQALALTSGGKGSKSLSSSKGESHLDVTNLAQTIGELTLGASVEDPDSEGFTVSCEAGVSPRIVVGWIHVFPNYSTYLAKAGLYIEALYIRKPYRRLGLGKMLLKKVAQEAVKRGTKRMEWAVGYSNFPAINFCEDMGAQIKPGFRRCVLDREALLNCKP